MPQARTQEERDITRRCKAWAFKIAGKKCYVIFHVLPRRLLGTCHPGIWKLKRYGMRSFQHNVIVLDIPKIKKSGHDIEGVIFTNVYTLKSVGMAATSQPR